MKEVWRFSLRLLTFDPEFFFCQDKNKREAILKALKLYFGEEAEKPIDFTIKVCSIAF